MGILAPYKHWGSRPCCRPDFTAGEGEAERLGHLAKVTERQVVELRFEPRNSKAKIWLFEALLPVRTRELTSEGCGRTRAVSGREELTQHLGT